MSIAFFNNLWINEDEAQIRISDRFIRVGDSFFETILVEDGIAYWLENHYERIVFSAKTLEIELNVSFENFQQIVYLLIYKNKLLNAKIRFVIYRKGDGTYLSSSNEFGQFAFISPFKAEFNISFSGIIYRDILKPVNKLSALKSSNALLYVLASKHYFEKNFSEAIILNEHGRVCETTKANIYLVKGTHVFTPPISEGCVAGVCRQAILQKFNFTEQVISEEDLQDADEVFSSNTLNGLTAFKSIANKAYTTNVFHQLNADFLKFKIEYYQQNKSKSVSFS